MLTLSWQGAGTTNIVNYMQTITNGQENQVLTCGKFERDNFTYKLPQTL